VLIKPTPIRLYSALRAIIFGEVAREMLNIFISEARRDGRPWVFKREMVLDILLVSRVRAYTINDAEGFYHRPMCDFRHWPYQAR